MTARELDIVRENERIATARQLVDALVVTTQEEIAGCKPKAPQWRWGYLAAIDDVLRSACLRTGATIRQVLEKESKA